MFLSKNNVNSTILDGDPFQPLWYNWIYEKENTDYKLNDALEFYTKAINEDKITFPDLYIIFNVEYDTLLTRKENDNSRKRTNFKKHKNLIPNLQGYFKFIKKETDIHVMAITYHSVEQAKQDVLSAIKNSRKPESKNNTKTINQLATWLRNHEPTL